MHYLAKILSSIAHKQLPFIQWTFDPYRDFLGSWLWSVNDHRWSLNLYREVSIETREGNAAQLTLPI